MKTENAQLKEEAERVFKEQELNKKYNKSSEALDEILKRKNPIFDKWRIRFDINDITKSPQAIYEGNTNEVGPSFSHG